MKINAIIESKDGGTLVLDFPRSIYDVYEKLQSVGIRQSPHQITLSDEEGDDVRVKLYSEDEIGKHLLLTLKEHNSLADANMLAFMVDNAKPDFRSKLEQNLLNDQYSSMQEVTDDIKQKRKMHDLKNRAAIADEYVSPVFVSIHMNSYPDSRYSGLQVWYSKNDERSRSFASYVQSYAAAYLDPSNTRVIKPATSSIYLLDRLQVPAILIECGFLSNENESALLASDDYQTKLALVIFAALCDSISANM